MSEKTTRDLVDLSAVIARQVGVDPDLVSAIISIESGWDPWAVRFEPGWKQFLTPDQFAVGCGISEITEKQMQATSWGLMQMMGTVARELGYRRPLTALVVPEENIKIGALKLRRLLLRFQNETDAISAYNQGNARKTQDGKYANQHYVDKALSKLAKLRAVK